MKAIIETSMLVEVETEDEAAILCAECDHRARLNFEATLERQGAQHSDLDGRLECLGTSMRIIRSL